MWSPVVGFSIFPHIGGFLGWFFNRNSVPTWYENLKKPSWCPSNQMFPIAWTLLYTGMGYGSFLIWTDVGGFNSKAIIPLGLFGAQLALNWAWPPLFFGIHNLRLALLDILCLDGLVVATMYSWYPINKLATMLMVPYLAWLAMATCLTYVIWMDNPEKKPRKKE
ncbi:translocator protein 2 [Alligator mississippiensis]|uniref:Translocator protein 2 n=1 Tax=Alligator mississippiensis TaxID=8496 RepID=A0A151P4P2_ALLMI|nr:translocator protein 2 [Alligator mississippiensis]XP_019338303.1 translocator protein 2 [Alligator mississippiensis]KYO44016.1 translocator protein 2 [Alligator mississippiensis]